MAYHSLSRSRVHVNTQTLHAAITGRSKQRRAIPLVALPILLRSRPVDRERSRARGDALHSPKVGTLEAAPATPTREDDNRSGMAGRSFLREKAKKRAGNCVSDAASGQVGFLGSHTHAGEAHARLTRTTRTHLRPHLYARRLAWESFRLAAASSAAAGCCAATASLWSLWCERGGFL